jgi:hypothetical protein
VVYKDLTHPINNNKKKTIRYIWKKRQSVSSFALEETSSYFYSLKNSIYGNLQPKFDTLTCDSTLKTVADSGAKEKH